jgi:hypothetical protein
MDEKKTGREALVEEIMASERDRLEALPDEDFIPNVDLSDYRNDAVSLALFDYEKRLSKMSDAELRDEAVRQAAENLREDVPGDDVVCFTRYALHRLLVYLMTDRLLQLPDAEWGPYVKHKELEAQVRVDSYANLLHEMSAEQIHQEVVAAADVLEKRLAARHAK